MNLHVLNKQTLLAVRYINSYTKLLDLSALTPQQQSCPDVVMTIAFVPNYTQSFHSPAGKLKEKMMYMYIKQHCKE